MRTSFFRTPLATFAILLASLSSAGTLTVTAPKSPGFLGRTNTITFNIADAVRQVKVTATATPPSGDPIKVSKTVTPDNNGNASGSLPLNFTEGATEGDYTIVVSAEETDNTYAPTTLTETLDVTDPKLLTFSPANGGTTRGLIRITGTIEEANLDSWEVKVDDQTVATGETTTISATSNVSGLRTDGARSIQVIVTDKAGNVETRNLSVTLDREAPTINVGKPTAGTKLRKGRDIDVIFDVTDASSSSSGSGSGVDRTGIDVQAKKDGTYIARVTLISLKGISSNTQRWTGILRYSKGLNLPSSFKIVISVVDRAGNPAVIQDVLVSYKN